MSNDSVKVAVRIRPLVKSEIARGCDSIVQKTPLQPQITLNSGTNSVYTFNYVFAPEDTQEMVYENAVRSMVLNLFKGMFSILLLLFSFFTFSCSLRFSIFIFKSDHLNF